MTNIEDRSVAPRTKGIVLHHAFAYDLLVWLRLFGRERVFRERLIDLTHLKPGDFAVGSRRGPDALTDRAPRRDDPARTVRGVSTGPLVSRQ